MRIRVGQTRPASFVVAVSRRIFRCRRLPVRPLQARGKGWAYWLRIPSYDGELLDDVRRLLDVGSISQEKKPAGPYYRLELAGMAQVTETLERLLPYLRTKRVLVEEWLRNH